jgi:hypothetical protein
VRSPAMTAMTAAQPVGGGDAAGAGTRVRLLFRRRRERDSESQAAQMPETETERSRGQQQAPRGRRRTAQRQAAGWLPAASATVAEAIPTSATSRQSWSCDFSTMPLLARAGFASGAASCRRAEARKKKSQKKAGRDSAERVTAQRCGRERWRVRRIVPSWGIIRRCSREIRRGVGGGSGGAARGRTGTSTAENARR